MEKTRVLIVDDDPNLSRMEAVILEQSDLYEVRVENQPANVLAAMRQYRPELLLLDVNMPGKSGGDLAREIRADPLLRRTPILFVTVLISKQEAGEHEVQCGGSHFLAKPVEPRVLLQSVERILKGQACAAEKADQADLMRIVNFHG